MLRELASKAFLNKKAWKEVGIEVFDASGKFQNLIGIVAQFEVVLGKLSDEQKIATLAMLGLTNKSNKFLLKLVGTSEEMEHFRQELLLAGGTMADVASKNLTPMQIALANVGGAWTDFGRTATAGGNLVALALDGIAASLDFINKLFLSVQLLFIQGWTLIARSIFAVIELINLAIDGMNKLPGIDIRRIPIAAGIGIIKGLEASDLELQQRISSIGEKDTPGAERVEAEAKTESTEKKQQITLERMLDVLEEIERGPVKLVFD